MEVLYTPITIDLITPNPLPVLKAKQGDTARGALITLTAGSALALTDETVRVFIKKPDGHIVYADCEIENGKVKAAYSYQMVAAAGKAELEIEIDDGSGRLSTPIAILQVMSSNISEAAIESTNEMSALQTMIRNAEAATNDANEAAKNVKDGVSPTVAVSDITGGHRITITDAEGTRNVDVMDGEDGATPQLSIGTVTTLAAGSNATASIGGTAEKPIINFGIPRGATGATPQFSIGTVTTLAAGSNATATLTGTTEKPVLNIGIPKGADGYTPQKGVDYFTEADKAELVQAVMESIGCPVFGLVDSNNNIVLTGELADGTYSIKYEMDDGSTVDIGNLVLDSNTYYSITNSLTNCTNSNSVNEVVEGGSYSATISANSGYELSSVKVTMGGTDVSASAVSGGNISIANVTGNIVITAVAEEVTVEIVNQIPLSTDTDGTIYNGIGYKTPARISSSGTIKSDVAGVSATGFIPAKKGNKVYLKGMYVEGDNTGYTQIRQYKADKSVIGTLVAPASYTDEGNGVYSYTITDEDAAYIRVSVYKVMDGSEIVTINQPIE